MTNGLNWQPEKLPLAIDVESKAVLKRLPKAHAALAELKGIASTIPNQGILINTLGLQEANSELSNLGRLVQLLLIARGFEIRPKSSTLIFIDEVQKKPEIHETLRYFKKDFPYLL